MHYYIYDSFVNDNKFLPELHRIEARLMDLGINGRTERLTLLKSLREIVDEAIKKGATTIVAVGNDETISKIISFFPNLSATLGIIPLGPNNGIAQMLGIPHGVAACDVLSARIVEKIDLGKANDAYFISSLEVPAQREISIDCGSYNISPLTDDGNINIYNFDNRIPTEKALSPSHSNPKDGILEAVFKDAPSKSGLFSVFKKDHYSRDSVFPFKKIKIKCSKECLPVVADGQITIKTPVTVEVAPKKLKVIVGKNRMF
jgi:diacylglycerol kinase family enzyme